MWRLIKEIVCIDNNNIFKKQQSQPCTKTWIGHKKAGNGTPLQYSCLENPMDGRPWWAAVNGVAKSRAWLSDFTFTFHIHALEKEMATHCSVLAWRIPGTVEPGGLLSMGSHRVEHDWRDLAAYIDLLRLEPPSQPPPSPTPLRPQSPLLWTPRVIQQLPR